MSARKSTEKNKAKPRPEWQQGQSFVGQNLWTLELRHGVRVTVHKILDDEGWFVTAPVVNLRRHKLRAVDHEAAQREGLEVAVRVAQRLVQIFEDGLIDEEFRQQRLHVRDLFEDPNFQISD